MTIASMCGDEDWRRLRGLSTRCYSQRVMTTRTSPVWLALHDRARVYQRRRRGRLRPALASCVAHRAQHGVAPQFKMPPGYHPPVTAVSAMRAGCQPSIFTMFKNPAPPPEYIERGLVFAGNLDTYARLAASGPCSSWARPASSTT